MSLLNENEGELSDVRDKLEELTTSFKGLEKRSYKAGEELEEVASELFGFLDENRGLSVTEFRAMAETLTRIARELQE